MPDETQDVNAESSTATDVNAESSTAAPVETTTPKVEQEEKVVPYDRFKEKVDETNYWREQAMLANQRIVQQPIQPQEQPDPYAGMDAQTRVFWQEVDKRTEVKIKAAKEEARREYQAGIESLALQNAKVQEKLFRNEQKDVLPGSREEVEIANLIRIGVKPDKAAMAVMGQKRIEAARNEGKSQKQNKTQEKAQANLETASIPANHGIPQKENLSFRERLAAKMQGAGL